MFHVKPGPVLWNRDALGDTADEDARLALNACRTDLDALAYLAARPWIAIPAFFSITTQDEGILPFRPWPWQAEWWRSATPREMIAKSRDIGASHATVALAVHRMAFYGHSVLILGNREKTAKTLLGFARQFIRDLQRGLPGLLPPAIRENTTETAFGFPTDGQPRFYILALPAGEDPARSQRAMFGLLSEHAAVQWAPEAWAGFVGALSPGAMVISESTPKGLAGHHGTMWTDSRNGYRKVLRDWKVNPNHTEAWATERLRDLGPTKFAQEYDVEFIQSGRPFFARDSIGLAPGPPLRADDVDGLGTVSIWEEPKVGPYYGGIDPSGGVSDDCNFAVHVILNGDGRQVVEARGRWTPDRFAAVIAPLTKRYPGLHFVEEENHGHAVILECRNLQAVGIRPWQTGRGDNRTYMLDRWELALRRGHGTIRSEDTVNEHRVFVYIERNGRLRAEAAPGKTDDGVIGSAIAWQAIQSTRGASEVFAAGRSMWETEDF